MNRIISIFIIFWSVLTAQDFEQCAINESENMTIPDNPVMFNPVYHFPPVNQDTTYVCWSFSTLSFIESEMQRTGMKPVKLAVMFPVYMSFLEKAKMFVESKGNSRFTAGDLFPTVIKIIQKYGIVPEEVYKGQTRFLNTYNHDSLYQEIDEFKKSINTDSPGQIEDVLKNLKNILNKHLGEPPLQFEYAGNKYTPATFRDTFVNLNWENYIYLTSSSAAPFGEKIKLDVPDNWRKDSLFLNLPLEQFYQSIKKSIMMGYSVVIDGDMSEPGRIGSKDIAFIPNFDIPGSAISQSARDYRFERGLTTDDHLMHLIGYASINNNDWFLIKDSWRDAFQGKYRGYFFYHESFVKLKVLAAMIHKDILSN